MAVIRIKNLKLRSVIGIHDWERENKQDVIINIKLEFDSSRAAESDDIADTVDYKAIKMRIIELVEGSTCNLLERLADQILAICLSDAQVEQATVRVDKPHALRFADSVSIEVSGGQAPSSTSHNQSKLKQ